MTITDDGGVFVHERTAKTVAERAVVKLPVEVLEGYVGRYTLAPGMVLEIKRAGERLFGAPTGQQALELFASSPEQFFVKEVEVQIRFETTADGTVQLHFAQGPFKVTAKRER